MVVSATVARAQPVHDAIDVPFDLNANHIYLRATVNGSRPLWFLLDTGAEMSVVDSTVAASVGLTSVGSATARGSGEGTMKAGFAQGVTLAVGRAVAKGQTVVTLPLDALEPIDGRSIDGILGHDFIASFVVTIDYSQRRVSFRDPARFDSATIPAGERVPIEIVGGIPRIHGTVVLPGAETIDGVFTVDTGSRTALSFNTPFVRENALVNRIAESSLDAPYGFGIGGATKTRVGRIDAFRIGVVKFEKPVIGFSFGEKGVDASSSIAGNIGGELMRRFRVTFDYGRKVMVLEPNAALVEPFRYDAFGALLSLDGEAFLVRRVVEGSAARRAGVREGDRIVGMDGVPAKRLTFEAVRQRLLDAGTWVRLRVEREGLVRDVRVKLRKLV
jgi:hypothetical protein